MQTYNNPLPVNGLDEADDVSQPGLRQAVQKTTLSDDRFPRKMHLWYR